ncbi:FadR/GntR family transcriptional regulator [soil metagenome]
MADTDFTAVKTLRAYEHIVAQVEMAIADGSLSPGQHLPSEREMMDNFAVSRPTVREALRVLESNGLVRSKHGNPRGPEILEPSADVLYRPVRQLVRTNRLNLNEFLPMRMSLDGLACALAASLRTEAHLDAMEIALAGMGATTEDTSSEAFSEADVDFHTAIWEATDNRLVSIFSNVTRDIMLDMIKEKIDHAGDSAAVKRLSFEHDSDIFAAIKAGDPERASYLARRYIYEYYNEFVTEPERAILRSLIGSAPAGL